MRPPAYLATLGLWAAMAGCGSLTDDRPPTWSYIAPAIIAPNCATANCHSRVTAAAGLDLSTADNGYESLTKLKAKNNFLRPLVVPTNPANSRVINMMRAQGATRMPPERALAEADIALVEQWILLGAKND